MVPLSVACHPFAQAYKSTGDKNISLTSRRGSSSLSLPHTVTEKEVKMATQGISGSLYVGREDSFLASCISPDAD